MAGERIFTPSNAAVYGVAQTIDADGKPQTIYKLLDDIVQITFSTPVDAKPVMQLGHREQLGYTYGQRLYAGTIQVPANSYPSLFKLFDQWIQAWLSQSKTEDQISPNYYINVNAEDLPPFDIVIVSVPEHTEKEQLLVNTFVYVIKDVKIIETQADLNAVSPEGQVLMYRFQQSYIGQKLIVANSVDGTLTLNMDTLLEVIKLDDNSCTDNKFTSIARERLYGG